MTGTNDNRTQFQKMLKASVKRAWDIVLVYKLDRFSRDKYEMAIHRKTLHNNGAKLVSAMENIPDSPEGVILESLLEGMAQYYSMELSQKVRRGMNEGRKKGHFPGGYVLYGYKVVDKKVLIDDDKAEVVRYIYQHYAAGTIVKDIISSLTTKGILNRGAPFAKNTIYNILKNEKYSGVYHYGDEEYIDIYPQIIPTPLFELVRKKIEANRFGKSSLEVVYLLREKVICGYCGAFIIAESGTARSGKIERYYKCCGRKNHHNCMKSSIRKDTLENLIVDTTIQLLDNPETLSALADKIIAANQRRIQEQSVMNILLKEKNEIAKAIENILAAIEQGLLTHSMKSRLDELEIKQTAINAKILLEKTKFAVTLTKEDILSYVKTALEKEPKQMIDLLVNQIVLYDDKVEVSYKYTDKIPTDDEYQDTRLNMSFPVNSDKSPPKRHKLPLKMEKPS